MRTKIAEQILKITDEQGACKTLTPAQINALTAGKGRVEHLQRLADEYGYELRLERKYRKRENADGASKT